MLVNKETLFEYMGELKSEIIALKANPKNTGAMLNIADILNKLMPNGRCLRVQYTLNTDNLFFGIVVLPEITSETIVNIMTKDSPYNINTYKVELDSKLFSDEYNLTIDEILALLIHEVDTLIKNSTPVEEARFLIDSYLTTRGETLRISEYIGYVEILKFGIQEAARRSVSLFYNEYEIPTAIDEVLSLSHDIRTAIHKLYTYSAIWSKELDSKAIVIKWVIRLYKDILTYRIPSIHALERSIDLTGSQLEKSEMKQLIVRLKKIDDYSLINESSGNRNSFITDKKNAFDDSLKRFRQNGIKAYFDDFYELQFEVNNMDDDRGTAIMLLHKINSRLNIIEDYITTEEGLSPQSVKKLQKLYMDYDKLRGQISTQKLKSPRTLLIDYGDY